MTNVHLALLFLAVCVGHTFSEPIGKCPVPDPEERTEHLPDDTDCSKFWRCNHGIPELETCPDGLHFNRVLQVCDWPIRAGCDSNTESSQQPTSPSSTSSPPRDTICEAATEDRWHLPHSSDCTKFYKCDLNTGEATEFQCPDNLHFNAQSQVCDWPSQAGCDPTSGSSSSRPEITTSTSTPTTSSPRDPICDSATEDRWHLPHSSDCTKFYKCDLNTGEATEFQCPDNLHFNAESQVCDWPSEAGCDAASGSSSSRPEITTTTTTPKPTTSTSTPTTSSPRDPICDSATENRWHLPHPTDCTKFYKCDLNNGKAAEIQCPDNLHFNAESQVCDWPSEAGCDPASGSSSSRPEITTPTPSPTSTSTSTSTPTTSSPRDPICDSATEDRWHLPHPTDCTKFYKCDLSNGKATEIQCPDDLHFNAQSEVCDWPSEAGCDPASGSSSSRPEITTPTPTPSPSSSSTSTSTPTTSSPRDPICDSATEDRWHLPHPTDCTKFYKCDLSNGKATEIQCPDNLHFNAESQVCDWPSEAGCDPASGSSSSRPEITTPTPTPSPSPTSTSTSTSTPTTSSPRDPICDSATEDRWHLPHPTDCTKFYKCDLSNGKATEIQCPDDLHFNAQSEVCDWPSEAGCDPASGSSSSRPEITTTTPTSTSTPSPATSSPRDPICEGATEDRWHLPHPTDCAKFFKCDLISGKATEFQCPDNLHFNSQSQVCDRPSEAGCDPASGSSSARPEITTSTSTSTTTSPRDQICDGATEDRWYRPHPTDCRKFYKCDLKTGKATEFKCPGKLRFNVEAQVCDRRNAARCDVDSNSSSSESGSSEGSEED